MEARKKICKDCFLLELRTFYLKTEKVTGYCSKLHQRRNGNDTCDEEGSNERKIRPFPHLWGISTLHPPDNETLHPPQKRE